MQRVEIIASGRVQRVGVRNVVQEMGRDLGLCGTVQNQEPFDIRIIAEGEEGALEEFVKALRIEDGLIKVRDLEVNWEEATGEFPYFKVLRGNWHEEMEEFLDVVIALLQRSIEANEKCLAEARRILDEPDQNYRCAESNGDSQSDPRIEACRES